MTLLNKLLGKDHKERVIQKEKKSSAMKEKNIWQTIKNGIKRAIDFVIDVVLFIPRVLFYGIVNEATYFIVKHAIAVGEPACDDDLE